MPAVGTLTRISSTLFDTTVAALEYADLTEVSPWVKDSWTRFCEAELGLR